MYIHKIHDEETLIAVITDLVQRLESGDGVSGFKLHIIYSEGAQFARKFETSLLPNEAKSQKYLEISRSLLLKSAIEGDAEAENILSILGRSDGNGGSRDNSS